MISWLEGDMPSVGAAGNPGYAQDLAADLAGFSRDVRQEIDFSAAADNDPQTTYLGHSYGGAAVGLSETHGLDADRVLHMGSAGMGHDVLAPGDLPSSQSGVDRFSMTAPGDWIGPAQGHQSDDFGHGADPDTFPGVTRLDAGDKVDGTPNDGWGSHSNILEPGSDAWRNAFNVLTGAEVRTYSGQDD